MSARLLRARPPSRHRRALHLDVGLAWRFMHGFVRNPAAVGAIAPSSRQLAEAMMRDLALGNDESVLELGPGTGAFTREIRDTLPRGARYLGIECEARFVELLSRKYPEMEFVEGRAENAFEHCRDAGISNPAAIISGLPFATLCEETREAIVASMERLMVPGTVFRTFQYAHAYRLPGSVRFRDSMNRVFGGHERSDLVMLNLPPAFVLTWSR